MRESIKSAIYALAIGALVMVVVNQCARAHALLSTGEPVPEWIRKACCGVSDFHHLTKDQVHLQPDGSWLVDGYKKPIPKGTELPSADGEIYIFYRDFSDGTQSSVYCFFYGFQGM